MIKAAFILSAIFIMNIIIIPQQHNQKEEKMENLVSLKTEHKKLHSVLAEATKEEGTLGKAAKELEEKLHPHFVKEEEIAIPPLSLLKDLSQEKFSVEMKPFIKMSDQLRSELPQMLNEHKEIVKALTKFEQIAKQRNKNKYVEFAEELRLHALNEEEITYPASIVIGDYLKLKFKM